MTTDAVLLDIEGTTTSIAFVYDVLFPYAARRIPSFLTERWDDPAVATARTAILADATPAERSRGEREAVPAVVARQMAADIKANGLKQLQGLVWREGYESGAVQGHVFNDVPRMLQAWRTAGRAAAIYSSGSVLAQQLLFGHSEAGDLRPLLSGWYDTTSGPKREAGSYRAIAQAWGRAPETITFCTDQPAEAAAAQAAGCTAIVIMRPGNAPLPANLPFPVHADLNKV